MFYVVNLISIGRIIGACSLLLTETLTIPFFVIYLICGISDMMDGYLARKAHVTSRLGEVLDSTADTVLLLITFSLLVPILLWERWLVLWISLIAFIRLAALAIGFGRFHTFAWLHTYINKAAGALLFFSPFFITVVSIPVVVSILCFVASISAIEEFVIIVRTKELDRNVAGLFFHHPAKKDI